MEKPISGLQEFTMIYGRHLDLLFKFKVLFKQVSQATLKQQKPHR